MKTVRQQRLNRIKKVLVETKQLDYTKLHIYTAQATYETLKAEGVLK